MELKQRKKFIVNAVILVAVAALTFFYLYKSGIVREESFSAITFSAVLLLFSCFVLSLAVLGFSQLLIFSTFTKSYKYRHAFLSACFGHLGSGITPFRSGHFPLMSYYLYKDGVNPSVFITGFFKCQIVFSAVSLLVYILATVILAVTGLSYEIAGVTLSLWTVVAVGAGFHLAVFTAITVLAYNKKLQSGALKVCAKIAGAFSKKFDKARFINRAGKKLADFRTETAIIGKNFKRFIIPAALYAVNMFLSGSFQYIAYLLITGNPFSLDTAFTFYILNLASQYIGNVIPLPGGAGTAEMLFVTVFASVIDGGTIGAVLVLWRFSTYYIPLIAEFLLLIPTAIKRRNIAETAADGGESAGGVKYTEKGEL